MKYTCCQGIITQCSGSVQHRPKGPVHAPDQEKVELAPAGIVQELPPGCPVGQVCGGDHVHVLHMGLPSLGLDELPQRQELGLGILVLVRGGDPCVEAYLHGWAFSNLASTCFT